MLSAAQLASVGHTVYATMRNLDKQDDLLSEVEKRGGRVQILRLDVTDNESIIDVIETIDKEQGRLDVLINNAGYGIGGFFEDLLESEIREQMETNFFGVLKVTRQSLPLLRYTAELKNGTVSPRIINISSINGRVATPGLGAYTSSKFALEGFSEGLYHELRPFGVFVALIEPGSYLTKIFTENARRAKWTGNPESPYTPYSEKLQNLLRYMVKTGRGTGDPDEVTQLIQKVVEKATPKLRYPIGKQVRMRLFLKQVVSFRRFSRIVLKAMYGKGE